MKRHFSGIFAGTILLLVLSAIVPGCTTTNGSNLTVSEIQTTFLDNAGKIHDYQSEYISTPGEKVRFDWKTPSLYRMEYLKSQNPATGTIFVMNHTTAVQYNAEQKNFQIAPDFQYLPQHDYQRMVQQIVRDGRFTIIGRDTGNGHTIYGIEVVTEPWSTKYTTYLSAKVRAWIDPETGLAGNISTYYPADTVNNVIRYDRLDVNTGMPDDYFSFVPPKESAVSCGSDSGISYPENFDRQNLSPALEPGCLSCTQALLTRPIGGFSGNRLLVPLYIYEGSGRLSAADPSGEINYTFYSRTMSPGKVRYQISRVEGLYETVPIPIPGNISIHIKPDKFIAETDHEYISKVTVHVEPATVLRENFWIYIHADVDSMPDAITDDWVRLAVDDGSTMSGAGLWHFYTGGGGYCQKVLVIRQGESGSMPFAIRTGELDTGNVTLGLVTSPCKVDHGPLRPDERPAWPEGIHATMTPETFIVRSFASYLPDMSFTIDPAVKPGDYCFSAILRTPTGGRDYAPFTVRVIPGG